MTAVKRFQSAHAVRKSVSTVVFLASMTTSPANAKGETSPLGDDPPPTEAQIQPNTAAADCGKRKKCNEMADCAEARARLITCGETSLDRDHDGIPCESLCGSK